MLCPLGESSLPVEILYAWQRSGQNIGRETSSAENQPQEAPRDRAKERLVALLKFLELEVDNEGRNGMAKCGNCLPTEKKNKDKPTPKEVATASALLVSKNAHTLKQTALTCIFCKMQHESENCECARKLSLEEREAIVKKEGACFYCSTPGHIKAYTQTSRPNAAS